ncbi:MAG: pyruvate dehydrogenase complex dihydrolipoamide acetyltransferase [Deltaproteobacteria bacterium]|nr:pyruvate dehydrogenase complex dihydrolipoamide acetyltransferase [Deltaproteobacteria bacterium]
MAVSIAMPLLSPTMTEGTIARWNKKEGDAVKSGDALAEVETDKATLDVEAYDEGTLLKIVVPAGGKVAVGAPIAIVGKPGEDFAALLTAAPTAPAPAPAPAPAAPAPAPAAARGQTVQTPAAASPATRQVPPQPVKPLTAPTRMIQAAAPARPATNGFSEPAARVRSSPLARRMARDSGLELRGISGSGPGGRVVKRDVEELLARGGPAAPGVAPAMGDELIPLSNMRRVIAQRLVEAKRNVPHFYLTVEIDMERAMALRTELKEGGSGITVNDLIVRACALALVRVPQANRSFTEDGMLQHHASDVGVAVALEDGLITPVVRSAEQKTVSQISAEVKTLAERARNRKLLPEEYTGGSMAVSNLGMYGVDEFIAVINPPQSCILAVGAVAERPAAVAGKLEVRKRMSATLSCDHRAIDGATGAKLLAEIKALLEKPLALGF